MAGQGGFNGNGVEEYPANKKEDAQLPGESRVGKILYEVHEMIPFYCDLSKEFVQLEFYEHALVCRSTSNWLCCCKCLENYQVEVLPRFKIVNVTFTNGRRNKCCWILTFFILGLFFLVIGSVQASSSSSSYYSQGPPSGSVVMILIGLILLLAAPIPLLGCRKYRYVTFDVKGLRGGPWFSRNKVCQFRFRTKEPDEGFVINYVYEALRQGFSPVHTLSHLHSADLALPLKSELTNDIRTCLSLQENEKVARKGKKQQQAFGDSFTSVSYPSVSHGTP